MANAGDSVLRKFISMVGSSFGKNRTWQQQKAVTGMLKSVLL
jgi:hypothetical protein